MYQLESDAAITDRRFGTKISALDSLLSEMAVGQSFAIPCKPRTVTRKGVSRIVQSPERGFNVKIANTIYAPKVFKKKRVFAGQPIGNSGRTEPVDAIRVFRVE